MSEHQPFSQLLRRSTAAAHERAHHSTYMDALLGGRLALDDYATLVVQYWHVYGALEDGADRLADDPVVGGFAVDALRRREAIAADLAALRGPGWADDLPPLPATARYASRIRAMVDEWPGGWVAHHYTRYLGDLAGGQAVRGLLRRTYGVTGDGARFYDFGALGPVPPFRTRYRALLDTAAWDDVERARIADEACHAFELNIAMLADLAGTVPPENLAA
ncbi:biliverdin-producing heme oxygenase [Actinomycetospora sp. NBRC 106375]|uniref:biliverdin-producing heme oxygenase n=1 Tax=Actinomycetospora sp. NBRC 106375 TaxID=3032207 RepID=UPI0024A0905C|nr:biliverdin-producing heme oxygenase [Actinomycetospora sp. NBRC 106375]GLZ47464.1 biliverdin-producing heme oxygenase [Actinomycetospora sp. NBRC 106375]